MASSVNAIIPPGDRMEPPEAANFIGVNQNTLATWRCSGRHSLPFTKVGRKIFYSRRTVAEWLNQRTGTSVSQIRQLATA